MTELRTYEAVTWEVREAAADSGLAATIEGLAVPYGVTIQVPDQGKLLRETVAPGAIDPAQAIGRPITWRHGDPIGVITHAQDTPGGLLVRGDIANTSAGRDAATLLRMKAAPGLSVGLEPITDSWNRTKDAVTRVKAALQELAVTHMPAYPTAVVSVIREETPMPDQAETLAAPEQAAAETVQYATHDELLALRERVASMPIQTVQRERSADDFLRELGTTLVTRAWPAGGVDVKGSASDIPAVPTEVSAVVEYGRPTVSAIGVSPLGDTGMQAEWMLDKVLPAVDVQATEFAVIATADPSGEIVNSPVVTYAGGNRVSIQFLMRASVWDYPHLLRSYAEQYARKVNAAVAATVQAAAANTISVPANLTLEQLGQKLGQGAAAIAAGTGRAPSVVVLDPHKFFQIGTLVGAGFPLAGGQSVGNADLASLSFQALGLAWVCDPSLVNGGYMLDRASIGIKESAGAPFQIDAAVVQELARDTALYGFVAHKVLNPAGICSFTTGAAK